MKKNKAYLFGPFFGEVSWEFFRFAPYAIHLKKTEPDIEIIVMTRQDRFDLYGQYADILVPLKIDNEASYSMSGFKLVGFDLSLCQKYCDIFRITYKKKYQIVACHVPDVSSLMYKLKWQFPRDKMDYDYLPRDDNSSFITKTFKHNNIVLVDEGYHCNILKYHVINTEDIKERISKIQNDKITYLGCLIELIRQSRFVISNLSSDVGRLSVLLKTPLIFPLRTMQNDNVFLLNPLKTPIIDCENILEGVELYENNI